jgi:hypothetical protein
MMEMSSSTSTFFKKRASTTYPLVERLIKAGYLAQSDDIATERGVSALRAWLSDPLEFGEVAHTVDFVRLRTFYLGATETEDRELFLNSALKQLAAHESSCQDAIARYTKMGDEFSALATEGVLFETRARIAWLTASRKKFLSISPGKPKER